MYKINVRISHKDYKYYSILLNKISFNRRFSSPDLDCDKTTEKKIIILVEPESRTNFDNKYNCKCT